MNDGSQNRRKPVQRHMDPYRKREASPNQDDDVTEGVIEGRNAVIEALRAGRPIDKVYIAKGETDAALGHIASKARDAGAVVVEADRRKLDAMSATHAHQGVVALASVKSYVDVEDILRAAKDRGEAPLIVVCDEISDPHNLGAVIRTAECAGAHGIIIPKRRSAGITAIVSKTSAGAVEHMAVARVANLTSALQELKRAGVWIYGATSVGDRGLWETDLTGPAAVVIGSEGGGMSRLVEENCDFKIRIPMVGKISSLNASVSASVILYEAFRQRSMK
jgi:23S rRNA (guanosine2251-2'-O)-methyltransferase